MVDRGDVQLWAATALTELREGIMQLPEMLAASAPPELTDFVREETDRQCRDLLESLVRRLEAAELSNGEPAEGSWISADNHSPKRRRLWPHGGCRGWLDDTRNLRVPFGGLSNRLTTPNAKGADCTFSGRQTMEVKKMTSTAVWKSEFSPGRRGWRQ